MNHATQEKPEQASPGKSRFSLANLIRTFWPLLILLLCFYILKVLTVLGVVSPNIVEGVQVYAHYLFSSV